MSNATKAFADPAQVSRADWSDPRELERTWQAAAVRVPTGGGNFRALQMHELARATPPLAPTRHPTVIFLHGCAGLWAGSLRRIDLLARHGFAVIAPASFARRKYPRSCDPATRRGGMYRGTVAMRQLDAGHAIVKAKTLAWVDPRNVFLMGLSQGGIVTATFSAADPAARVNARVVEGWTCHAGWSEYRGVRAPASEPVITLVAAGDPWFQSAWTRGHCGRFLHPSNGSRSIVYRDAPLRDRHGLLEDESVSATVLEFLRHRLVR